MTDGKSEAQAAERSASRIAEYAAQLAFELMTVKGRVTGVPDSAIEIVNEELELAGLDVQLVRKP